MNSVTVPLYHYGLLKGYLSGQNAPSEILTAVEALYMAAIQGPLRADAMEAIQAVREAAERLAGLAVASTPVEVSIAKPKLPIVTPDTAEIELPPLTKRALEIAAERPIPPVESSQPQMDEAKVAAFLEAGAVEQCPPAHGAGDDHEAVVGTFETKKRKEWSPEARAAAGERMRARQAKKRNEPEDEEAEDGELESHRFADEVPQEEGDATEPDKNLWQQWQIDKLIEMKRSGAGSTAIGNAIGKTAKQVANKWTWLPEKLKTGTFQPVSVDRLIENHRGYAGKRDPEQQLEDSDWPDIQTMLTKQRRSVSQVASDYDVDFDTMRAFIDKHQGRPPGEA